MHLRFLTALVAAVCLALTPAAHAADPAPTATLLAPDFVFDGPVTDIAVDGDYTYVAGSFTSQRTPTGGAVVTPVSGNGQPDQSSFPKVVGSVDASVADGQGGWFIAGSFSAVGTTKRANLAHVLADGSVDPNFTADRSGHVSLLARSGSTLYTSGSSSVAAFDATTGRRLIGFIAPEVDSDEGSGLTRTIDAILPVGDRLYIGGDFSSLNGQPRRRLAALDAATGALTSFSADIRYGSDDHAGAVRALATRGTTLYVGGTFTTVNGTTRKLLAGLNLETGALADFNADVVGTFDDPAVDFDRVSSLDLHEGRLYLAGGFETVGGQKRASAAAVDAATGAVTNWNPPPALNGVYKSFSQILATDSSVLVAGSFTTVGDKDRSGLAALDPSTASLSPWNPEIGSSRTGAYTESDGPVRTLSTSNGRVLVGGQFAGAGPARDTRRALVRLRADGTIDTTWNPSLPAGPVDIGRIAVGPTGVYAFGHAYDRGSYTGKLFAYNKTSGTPATAPPIVDPPYEAYDMLVTGGKLVVGGWYGPNRQLGEYDLSTGDLNSWNPSFEGTPGTAAGLAVTGNTLYVTGAFDKVDGHARRGLAAFTLSDHSLTSLAPGTAFGLGGSVLDGDILYDTQHALDRSTGAVLPWSPTAPIGRLITGPDALYGALSFDPANPDASGLARIDKRTGATTRLADAPPGFDVYGGPFATPFVATNQHLLVGGNGYMIGLGTTVTGPLARFALQRQTGAPPTNMAPPSISGDPRPAGVLTCAAGTWTGSPGFAFTWLRDGAPIAGATSPKYTVANDDVGHRIGCRVTASNDSGSGTTSSADVSAYAPPIPSAPDVPATETPRDTPTTPSQQSAPTVTAPVPSPTPKPDVPSKARATLSAAGVARGRTLTIRLANVPNKAKLNVSWKPKRGRAIRQTVTVQRGAARVTSPKVKGRYRLTVTYRGTALLKGRKVTVR